MSVTIGTNKNIQLIKAESSRGNGDSDLSITENAILTFTGTSTLIGKYDFPPMGDANISEPCFIATDDSSIILPSIKELPQVTFCFDNDFVKQLYNTRAIEGKGRAKVTIDKYILLLTPFEGWNSVHVLNFETLPTQ